MNVRINNKRNTFFHITDLEVQIVEYFFEKGVTFYKISVKLLAQIWFVRRRFSDFDKMHNRLVADIDPKRALILPHIPPKRFFYNTDPAFLNERVRGLNDYLKQITTIYEAINNPILQRFLDIDINYNPLYEYTNIVKPAKKGPIGNPDLPKQRVISNINFLTTEKGDFDSFEDQKESMSSKMVGLSTLRLRQVRKPSQNEALIMNSFEEETKENENKKKEAKQKVLTHVQKELKCVSAISNFYTKQIIDYNDISSMANNTLSKVSNLEKKI